jgi:hypothetical protein
MELRQCDVEDGRQEKTVIEPTSSALGVLYFYLASQFHLFFISKYQRRQGRDGQ